MERQVRWLYRLQFATLGLYTCCNQHLAIYDFVECGRGLSGNVMEHLAG